jgi:hypothetical protein
MSLLGWMVKPPSSTPSWIALAERVKCRLSRRYRDHPVRFWCSAKDMGCVVPWQVMKEQFTNSPDRATKRLRPGRSAKASEEERLRSALDCEAAIGFAPGNGSQLITGVAK